MIGRHGLTPSVTDDSILADVLVVSASGNKELPARVGEWIERSISHEGDDEPVLVALVDGGLETEGSAVGFVSSLEQIANRQKARFLHVPDWKEHLSQNFKTESLNQLLRHPLRESILLPSFRSPPRCRNHE